MSNSKNNGASTGGVSAVGVVQIVFIIMKLCKTAPIGGWPWWKVMLPMECSVSLICCIGCCGGGCAIISLCLTKDDDVAKPGVALSEQQIRDIEASLYKTDIGNPPSVDSEATTSPSRHDNNQSSLHTVSIETIEEMNSLDKV